MGYKYKVNHEYFNVIDTEYKAYILGFIYADGSIIKPKGNRQMNLRISIQEEDGYILQKLADEAAGGQVKIVHSPAIQKKGWKKRASLTIVSDKICSKLIEYGCKINKSQVGMDFPNIDSQLVRHFVRGFFDGDGCITDKKVGYNYKRKTFMERKGAHKQRYQTRIAFTSTCIHFLAYLIEAIDVSHAYWRIVKRKQEVTTVWIERVNDVSLTIDYMYKDANYYLERKFNKTIKSRASGKSEEGLETRDTTVSPEHPAPTVK